MVSANAAISELLSSLPIGSPTQFKTLVSALLVAKKALLLKVDDIVDSNREIQHLLYNRCCMLVKDQDWSQKQWVCRSR